MPPQRAELLIVRCLERESAKYSGERAEAAKLIHCLLEVRAARPRPVLLLL